MLYNISCTHIINKISIDIHKRFMIKIVTSTVWSLPRAADQALLDLHAAAAQADECDTERTLSPGVEARTGRVDLFVDVGLTKRVRGAGDGGFAERRGVSKGVSQRKHHFCNWDGCLDW